MESRDTGLGSSAARLSPCTPRRARVLHHRIAVAAAPLRQAHLLYTRICGFIADARSLVRCSPVRPHAFVICVAHVGLPTPPLSRPDKREPGSTRVLSVPL